MCKNIVKLISLTECFIVSQESNCEDTTNKHICENFLTFSVFLLQHQISQYVNASVLLVYNRILYLITCYFQISAMSSSIYCDKLVVERLHNHTSHTQLSIYGTCWNIVSHDLFHDQNHKRDNDQWARNDHLAMTWKMSECAR